MSLCVRDRIHIPSADVKEMVQHGVVKRHVVRPTVQLVLVEGYQAPMVDQVVD